MTHVDDEAYRFLSLTGIIVEEVHHDTVIETELEALKRRTLVYPADKTIVLHRKDILYRNGPFTCLQDPARQKLFDTQLLAALARWKYKVITVVIDKRGHRNKYKVWQAHPYHYCLEVLLEKFVLFLRGSTGDVLAESRGTDADKKLSDSYAGLHKRGTPNVGPKEWQTRLSTSQLKLKKKTANIAGLQLADLIAYPSQRGILQEKGLIPKEKIRVFGDAIWEILCDSKYDRNWKNVMDGYGKKLLP